MDGGAWWAIVHGVTRVRHNWAQCSTGYTKLELADHPFF